MKKLIALTSLAFLILVLGCLQTGPVKEVVLAPNEGVGLGLPGFSLLDKVVRPNSITFLSISIRNNAEGQIARNVIVSIDNIEPFKLVACSGNVTEPTILYSEIPECGIYYDLDMRGRGGASSLHLNQHGTSELLPGQELELMWTLKSPPAELLGGICMCEDNNNPHQLYSTMDYDYKMIAQENIVYMSNEEYRKIKQENGTVNIPSTFKQTAGEFKIDHLTQIPKLYFATTELAQATDLSYEIYNRGKGFSPSGITIIIEYPPQMEPASAYKDFGWETNEELGADERTAIRRNFPEIDMSHILFRHIPEDRIRPGIKFPVTAPLELKKDELSSLIAFSIPQKTYNIGVYLYYTYRVENLGRISVSPAII